MSLLPLPHNPLAIVLEGSQLLGLELDRPAAEKMLEHLRLVEEWGKRTNLTALSGLCEMAVFHLLDSLTVFKVLPKGQQKTLADIGTGAGFPGLVLKIADNGLQVALVDYDPKKIVFLKHVVRRLELSNVTFVALRLNSLLAQPGTKSFDVVVTRALSSDPSFFSSLSPLVGPSGSLVKMAGPGSSPEEFEVPGFRLVDRWDGTLPFSTSSRTVCRYAKNL